MDKRRWTGFLGTKKISENSTNTNIPYWGCPFALVLSCIWRRLHRCFHTRVGEGAMTGVLCKQNVDNLWYQKIEKVTYDVVLTAIKLQHYFQSHSIIVNADLLIRKVLSKPDLVGRMVAWSVELSKYNIRYESQGPIKAQVLANFAAKLVEGDEDN